MNTEGKDALQSFVNELGLTYTATFVPTPQPVETVPHPQLHWSISLQRGSRILKTSYSQGCGHAVGYQQFRKSSSDKRQADADIRRACETGKIFDYRTFRGRTGYGAQPNPELLDVLYCLVLDADVANRSGFTEWAADYGYNADSRKAESIYNTCLSHFPSVFIVLPPSLALKALIGQQALERLAELFQDY